VVAAHQPGSPNLYVTADFPGNPDFKGDQGYSSAPEFPDEPTRLLAPFRYWNMVQYFFPYADVMDHDWQDVLPDLIPKFVNAQTAVEYHLAIAEMTASINDAHAFTYSPVLEGYFGRNVVPVQVRLVENQTVVTQVLTHLLDDTVDLRVGDRVVAINGVGIEAKRAELRKLLNGSNEASLERNVHDSFLRTNADHASLTVRRDGVSTSTLNVNTVTLSAFWREQAGAKGEVSAILPGNIGYVHMGRLQAADVDGVMAKMRATHGIVFDIRNYPNWTIYFLSNYLNPTARPFAKFRQPDFDHPGRFFWGPVYLAGPGSPNDEGIPPAPFTYTGRVVVLVNQETQSQAEFTVMALQTAADATVIGSQTAGADGNISLISLPGGISTYFSGIGVFYPDGRPTQRVGIVPDVVVKPTIQGVRDGRDEVLEAALDFLL
jgi:C-terminal processing protease CtpA/Prc